MKKYIDDKSKPRFKTLKFKPAKLKQNKYPKDLSEEYQWLEPTNENIYWEDDYIKDVSDTVKPPTPYEEMGGVEEEEE